MMSFLFVCSFVSLISANSIHSFLHGSNQTALQYPSCLTASTGHRETHCLSIATRHRTEHPHTMSQRGITRNAWLHQDSSWDSLREKIWEACGKKQHWQALTSWKGLSRMSRMESRVRIQALEDRPLHIMIKKWPKEPVDFEVRERPF